MHMADIDQLYNTALDHVKADDEAGALLCLDELKQRLPDEVQTSRRWYCMRELIDIVKGDRKAFILDYGCGSGATIVFLLLLGYRNVYGADLVKLESRNKLCALLGETEQRFFEFDGKRLPFGDNSFDLAFSEQVLEHVEEPIGYYKEAHRILKPDAVAFFSFPHRFIPFDSHGRTWFVHMLPKPLALHCYRLLGRNVDWFKTNLHLKSVTFHRRAASPFFYDIHNVADRRLRSFSSTDLRYYKGNKTLRRTLDGLIKSPVLGGIVLKLLGGLSIASMTMKNQKNPVES